MVNHFLKSFLIAAFALIAPTNAAEISISRIDDAFGWQTKVITVSADSIVSNISSFNLTIAYDQTSALVYAVRPGNIFADCGWEYFTYKLIKKDSVVTYLPDYPVHLINVNGIASLSGNSPPSCIGENKSLFQIDLVLERVFHRQDKFLPFRFFWRDCYDNVLVSNSGDEVFSAQGLFENVSPTDTHVPFNPAFPGYGFPQIACSPEQNASVTYNLDFVNSGISPVIGDSGWCEAGDVNLNGVYYEVADAVMLIEYFTRGIIIYDINPAGQIAQTDCNCDGTVLSVADLVCFIRKALGDDRYAKIPVLSYNRSFISSVAGVNGRVIALTNTAEAALVYIKVTPKNSAGLESSDFTFENENLKTGQIGDTITLMLVDLEGNSVLSAGEHILFEYVGSSEFEVKAWVVDMSGQELAIMLEDAVLPDSPELLQNYPNPFNPSTIIEFNLPTNTEWKLEIYNVAGQLIKNFSGNSTGLTKIEWDGTGLGGAPVSSGVYFYRLLSGENTTTRKMLLLK